MSSIAIAAHRRTSGGSLRMRVLRCGVNSSSSRTWSTTRLRCSGEVSGGSRSLAAYVNARSTVKREYTRSSCGTIPMRVRIESCSACTSWPSTVTLPELGSLAPLSTSNRAELRAADGPTSAVNVPGWAVNDTSLSNACPGALPAGEL